MTDLYLRISSVVAPVLAWNCFCAVSRLSMDCAADTAVSFTTLTIELTRLVFTTVPKSMVTASAFLTSFPNSSIEDAH